MAQRLALVKDTEPGRRHKGPVDYSQFDDTAQATQAWLVHYDDRFLVCRSQGHTFPPLVPGKPLPRSAHTQRDYRREGAWQLVEYCSRCRRERVTTLTPGNVLGPGVHRRYKDPLGYGKPKGLDPVTKTQAFMEVLRRMYEGGQLELAPGGVD